MSRHFILYIERHKSVKKVVLPALQQHYKVTVVETHRDAIQIIAEDFPDLTLINVPATRFNLDRFCQELRDQKTEHPIFMLLNKGTRLDQLPRINGYVRHPFTTRQLLHRLERVLPKPHCEFVEWGELKLDRDGRYLFWESHQVPLTPKAAALVLAFLNSPEELLSRSRLMHEVWGTNYMGDTRTLDVHIHWLRKALIKLGAPYKLYTKRGKGYRLLSTESPVNETKE